MRARCSANTVVKVGGMCWVIRIGARSMRSRNCRMSVVSACGPPVEDPISSAWGKKRKRTQCKGRRTGCGRDRDQAVLAGCEGRRWPSGARPRPPRLRIFSISSR